MTEPRCYHCGHLLADINAPCPQCIPNFPPMRPALIAPSPQGDDRIAVLAAALKPFAEAWATATRFQQNASMAEIGAVAKHHVSGVHFQRAHAAIAKATEQ